MPFVVVSATGQLLEVLRVPGASHVDPGGSVLDLAEVVGCQLDCDCSDVLLEAVELGLPSVRVFSVLRRFRCETTGGCVQC